MIAVVVALLFSISSLLPVGWCDRIDVPKFPFWRPDDDWHNRRVLVLSHLWSWRGQDAKNVYGRRNCSSKRLGRPCCTTTPPRNSRPGRSKGHLALSTENHHANCRPSLTVSSWFVRRYYASPPFIRNTTFHSNECRRMSWAKTFPLAILVFSPWTAFSIRRPRTAAEANDCRALSPAHGIVLAPEARWCIPKSRPICSLKTQGFLVSAPSSIL
jgi:hypothetical protein